MSESAVATSRRTGRLPVAVAVLLLATVLHALSLQTLLVERTISRSLFSEALWQQLVETVGGRIVAVDGEPEGSVDLVTLAAVDVLAAGLLWLVGAGLIAWRTRCDFTRALAEWAYRGWLWWFVPAAAELSRWLALLTGLGAVDSFLVGTVGMWHAVMLAGWTTTLWQLASANVPHGNLRNEVSVPLFVWLAAAGYAVTLTAMNWQLYHNMMIPHGDSAMYEEHLWNVLHGKGFRSFLDQGLFLGEHIQVVHLLLLPLYVFWPSHLLLELCESLALASGAIPVFWMARRHGGSDRAAMLLAAASLLYAPLQYLDISIDLKTFRPISFGVPLLLFALDQWERGRRRTMLVLLFLTLLCKEDFAAVVAPWGVWMAVRQRPDRRLGWSLAAAGTAYVLLAVTVVIPWFRDGAEVHYAHYFGELGGTPSEIVRTSLDEPARVLGRLMSVRSSIYVCALVIPLAGLPLLSPGRLAAGFPLFAVLCLIDLTPGPDSELLIPFHHFHAPLVPVILWAAAAGLGNLERLRFSVRKPDDRPGLSQLFAGRFACTAALFSGLFLSMTPLGISFWDAGSAWYWRDLYSIGKRARMFDKVFPEIPQASRVASTDFAHTRFTHHERSYDYSHYARKVSGNQALRVPDDTDFIVIDTRHRYSEITSPEEIAEYREHPDRWERLPDGTDGYWIVLRRRE